MTQRFYYKQNRFKQLRAFCLAAKTGSVSKAAEQMFLSQPSASLLIQALEKELGGQFFERMGPRIKLTQEGRMLLDLALPLVEGLESLPDAFQALCHDKVSGNLAIAAGESTTLYLLPQVINQFITQYPDIQLKLHNVPGRQGLAMVRAGDVDLSVGPILDVPDDILYVPLISYEPILITPADHPLIHKQKVSLEDISPYGLIMPSPTMSTRNIIDMVFQQENFKYRVLMEAGGWEIIKKYVEMGLGIAIVTSICLTGNEKIARISLQGYFPTRSYGIILRRGKFISPAARRFIEIMGPDTLDDILERDGKLLSQDHRHLA